MNAADEYDVVVLGSGTGGKLMARTMAQEGHESQTTKG
jgi:pyruvate/2-oxoglutarate dehydrogenase complex dihydrolipoamide dehydrogenase (E3) component